MLLHWITLSLLVAIATGAGLKSGPITCECTTTQCVQQQTRTCTTDSLCFSQHLEMESGKPSLVRGCIVGRTPLLCENRKPSKTKNWPLLYCCGTDLCNRDAVPTPPPWHVELSKNADSARSLGVPRGNTSDNGSQETETEFTPEGETAPPSFIQKSPWPHIISPVYVSVLVLGIVSLIIIGIIAAAVIRRNNRFYAEHYGALEFQPGKTTHVHCDCDSEVDSVTSSQPYLHIVCPKRNT